MPVTANHYDCVRDHFKSLFGNECQVCGSVFNLEFHHKTPLNTKNGRGKQERMWEWFAAYKQNNLSLLCDSCHKKFHANNNGDNLD